MTRTGKIIVAFLLTLLGLLFGFQCVELVWAVSTNQPLSLVLLFMLGLVYIGWCIFRSLRAVRGVWSGPKMIITKIVVDEGMDEDWYNTFLKLANKHHAPFIVRKANDDSPSE